MWEWLPSREWCLSIRGWEAAPTTLLARIGAALIGGYAVYFVVNAVSGIRLSEEDEFNGADLSIHKIGAVSND